jgi:hypothetical protein
VLWEFNRFLPEKPCQTGALLKTLLLRLIGVELLATICVILPPAPSVLQEGSSDACVYTRGSVRRASGFVLTGKQEVIPGQKSAWRKFRAIERHLRSDLLEARFGIVSGLPTIQELIGSVNIKRVYRY